MWWNVNICLPVCPSWRWSRIFGGLSVECDGIKCCALPLLLQVTWIWNAPESGIYSWPFYVQALAVFCNATRRMVFALHVIVMSSAFFNPSFAFSSHFDTGKGQTDGWLEWLRLSIWFWCVFIIKLSDLIWSSGVWCKAIRVLVL